MSNNPIYNVRGAEKPEAQPGESGKRQAQRLSLRASFMPASINDEDRTVDVLFASDKPVRMWTWEYGAINEQLSFDPEHVRMDRLNSGAPLLDNHDAYGSVSDIVLGVVERAWIEKGKGHAKVRFSKTEKGERTMELVRDGILRNISVGYSVNRYQVTRSTEKGQPDLYRAVDWEPHEISLVAIPADYTAQVRMCADGRNVEIEYDPETELAIEREKQQKELEETLHQRRRELDILLARF